MQRAFQLPLDHNARTPERLTAVILSTIVQRCFLFIYNVTVEYILFLACSIISDAIDGIEYFSSISIENRIIRMRSEFFKIAVVITKIFICSNYEENKTNKSKRFKWKRTCFYEEFKHILFSSSLLDLKH